MRSNIKAWLQRWVGQRQKVKGLVGRRNDDSRLADEPSFPELERASLSHDARRLLTENEYKPNTALLPWRDGLLAEQ